MLKVGNKDDGISVCKHYTHNTSNHILQRYDLYKAAMISRDLITKICDFYSLS